METRAQERDRLQRVVRAAAFAAGIAAGWAQGLDAQNARTLTDGAVQLTYPETHYSATAPVNLLGTTPTFAVDQLAGSGWWYRVGGVDSREYPLPVPDVLDAGIGGVLNATWNNLEGGIKLEEHVFVADREGPSGGYVSELYVTYPSGPSRTLYLYHYLDPDVTGTAAGDACVPISFTALTFSEGTSRLHFRATAGNPVHFEAKPYPTLRDRLNDGLVDTLADTWPSTTGDMTGALQFAASIVSGINHRLVAGVSVAAGPGIDYVKGSAAMGLYPSVHLQNPNTHARELWRMRRANRLEPEPEWSAPNDHDILGSADFLGRKEDVLLERDQTGQYRIGGLVISEQPPLTWKVAATGDLNGDGRADILWRDTSTQLLKVWTMNGTTHAGTITPDPDHAVDANWEVVGLADFNGGGALDFLWYNQTSRKLVIWYMNPSVVRIAGGFTNPALVGNGNWKALATADWGKGGGPYGTPDILWQNDTSEKLVLWYMDSAANRVSGLFLTPDAAPSGYKLVGPR